MENNKTVIIIGLLVLNLVVVAFVGMRIMKRIDGIERSTRNEISSMKNEIWTVSDGVSDRVEAILEEQNNLVKETSIDIVDVDVDHMTATVAIETNLKEKNGPTTIECAIKGENEGSIDKVTMDAKDHLIYYTEVELSLKDDYTFSVIEVGEESSRIMNSEAARISLYSRYYRDRIMGISGSGSSGRNEFVMENTYELNLLSMEKMGPKKIEMQVMYRGEIIRTVDVTDEVLMGKDREALEEQLRSKMEEAQERQGYDSYIGFESGKASSAKTVAEREHEVTGDVYYMVHVFSGRYADYSEVKRKDELDVNYRITFKDGYIDGDIN